jgi:hypothetical protein
MSAITTKLQMRRGPATTWANKNPVLDSAEWGVETDTGKKKLGDGTTAWNSLPYDAEVDTRHIARLEDVIAQILLEIETQNLYPDYSNMILEDFKTPDSIDLYTCKVLSVVAGEEAIDCKNTVGLLPGSCYTLTDGIKSELVQVSGVSTENGVNRVVLTAPVQHTYSLSDTRIYRSSATLTNDGAEGPGLTKSLFWGPSIVWRGLGTEEENIAPLETTVSNADSFSVSGIISFAEDGTVTLDKVGNAE